MASAAVMAITNDRFQAQKSTDLRLFHQSAVHQAGRGAVMAAAATGPSNTSLAWTTSRWQRRPTGNGALARCRPARPGLCWGWPARLGAATAEDPPKLRVGNCRSILAVHLKQG